VLCDGPLEISKGVDEFGRLKWLSLWAGHRQAVSLRREFPPLLPLPLTVRLSPFVSRLKGSPALKAETEGYRLTVQVSGVAALIGTPSDPG
jgi:hypothetical protein